MPDLDDAYSLDGPEGSRRLYSAWAGSYDEGFARRRGYVYPAQVARLVDASGATGRILDVGAGTGLVGEALRGARAAVDGIDISAEMLAEARRKGVYDRLIEADLLAPLPIADGTYGRVVSAGTFTHGHVGPSCLDELLRVAAPGARFALGINAAVFDGAGFGSSLARLCAAGAIGPIRFEEVPIYAGTGHGAPDDRALVALFERGAAGPEDAPRP